MERLKQRITTMRENVAREVVTEKPTLRNILKRSLAGESNLTSAKAELVVDQFVVGKNIKFEDLSFSELEAIRNKISLSLEAGDEWLDEVVSGQTPSWKINVEPKTRRQKLEELKRIVLIKQDSLKATD